MPSVPQALPVPHGLVSEHVFAQTCLVPIVVQVAPAPQTAELVHALVQVPTVLPVSLMQTSVMSPAQSVIALHGLPRSELPAGVSSPGSVVSAPAPVSCGHSTPVSPPQGVAKPPPVLEHAALEASDARPKARQAIRVVHMCVAPSTDEQRKPDMVVRLARTFRSPAERGCTAIRLGAKPSPEFGKLFC